MEKEKKNSEDNPPPILIVTAIIIASLALGGIFNFLMTGMEDPIECYTEMVQTMTVQEVSDLLDMTLIEVTWLPDDLQVSPQITTYPSGVNGHRYCSVTIRYFHAEEPPGNSVSIQSREVPGISETPNPYPLSCSWNFTDTGPTGSNCDVERYSTDSTLDVQIYTSPGLSPDEILQVLDGLVIVEPRE